ncbi:T4 family baseplate hub assembly chaperone [Acidicapsa acidisoli]|uniref:T4 family baseplate hub assembly chaperone n=1 Tax=Acidicapsa acidisoli TaxID=1615681 RepID=UPI0021E015E6|nr:hypothetical protein [Acidicapsa acidisoli]
MAEPNLTARALALLAAAYPDASRAALAQLQIGERDRRLLALREQVFGKRLTGLAVCPGCESRMEFEFSVTDIAVPPIHEGNTVEPEILRRDGYEVAFHVPTSLDLAAVQELDGFDDRIRLLRERVVDSALFEGNAVAATELPQRIVAALDERLGEVDPLGDVRLNLVCGACNEEWQTSFDIVSFLWTEIHAWAIRLMREIHCLARAYGWHEADILAMSSWRRQRYLEMMSE